MGDALKAVQSGLADKDHWKKKREKGRKKKDPVEDLAQQEESEDTNMTTKISNTQWTRFILGRITHHKTPLPEQLNTLSYGFEVSTKHFVSAFTEELRSQGIEPDYINLTAHIDAVLRNLPNTNRFIAEQYANWQTAATFSFALFYKNDWAMKYLVTAAIALLPYYAKSDTDDGFFPKANRTGAD